MIELNSEEIYYFEKQVRYWSEELGLHSWMIGVNAKDEIDSEAYARTTMHKNWRTANVEIYTKIEYLPSTIDKLDWLNKTALHECLEILIAPLSFLASDIYADSVVLGASHEIIRVLEKTLIERRPQNEQ